MHGRPQNFFSGVGKLGVSPNWVHKRNPDGEADDRFENNAQIIHLLRVLLLLLIHQNTLQLLHI